MNSSPFKPLKVNTKKIVDDTYF